MDTISKYKKRQKTWGMLFLVSLLITFIIIPIITAASFALNSSSPAPLSKKSDSYVPDTSANSSPVLDVPTEASNSNQRITKSDKTHKRREQPAKIPDNRLNKKTQTPPKGITNKKTAINFPELDDFYVPPHSSNIIASQISPTPVVASNSVNPQMPSQTAELPTFLLVTGGVSLFSTVTTMLGFLTTTVFAWKREKREKESFRIEKEKKELELECLKIELGKTKQLNSSDFKSCPVCYRTYSDMSLTFCLDDAALLNAPQNSKEFQQDSLAETIIMESEPATKMSETERIFNKSE